MPPPPDMASALTLLSRQLQKEVTTDELYGLSQKMISHRIVVKLELSLANSLPTQRDKTRLTSLSLPHAGDWINVTPSTTLGLHVRPQEFRYLVLYRLGAPVYPSSGPCPAYQKPSDRFVDHAIVCRSHGERIARHHHLRDALYQVAVSANLGKRKMPFYLALMPDLRMCSSLNGHMGVTWLLMLRLSALSLMTG